MKKYVAHAIFLLAGIVIGVFISWGLLSPPTFPKVIEKIKPSVVPIVLREGNSVNIVGTGFIFTDKHYVITNAHITTSIKARGRIKDLGISLPCPSKGEDIHVVIPCRVLKQNTPADIAILMPNYGFAGLSPQEKEDITSHLKPVRIKTLRRVKVGQEVAMAGFPISDSFGSFHSFHKGIIAKIDTLDSPDMH